MGQGFNSMTDAGAYLEHFGIKGQRWGHRRFQNEDGTWTSAGCERYGKGGEPHEHTDTIIPKKNVTDTVRKANRTVSKVTAVTGTAGMALTAAGLVTGFVPAAALGASISTVSAVTSRVNFAFKIANEVGSSINTTIKDAKQTETTDGTGKKVTIGLLLGAAGSGVATAVGADHLTKKITDTKLVLNDSLNKESELWDEIMYQSHRSEEYNDKIAKAVAEEVQLNADLIREGTSLTEAYSYVSELEHNLPAGIDWSAAFEREMIEAKAHLDRAPDVPGERFVSSPDSKPGYTHYIETKATVQEQIDEMNLMNRIHNVKEQASKIDTMDQVRELARTKMADAQTALAAVKDNTNALRDQVSKLYSSKDLLTKAGIATTVALATAGAGVGIYNYVKKRSAAKAETDNKQERRGLSSLNPGQKKTVRLSDGTEIIFEKTLDGDLTFKPKISKNLHIPQDELVEYTLLSVDEALEMLD